VAAGVVACIAARIVFLASDLVNGPLVDLENVAYDARVCLATRRSPSPRVLVVSKTMGQAVAGSAPFRSQVAVAVAHLRQSGAAAIGIDFLLIDPAVSGAGVDAALARSLAGEDVVLGWELRSGEGLATTSLARGRVLAVERDAFFSKLRPLSLFAESALYAGLVNLETGAARGGVVRGYEMWHRDASTGGRLPALAFQVFLAHRARAGMDRLGIRAGDPRLAALARLESSPEAAASEALRVARAAGASPKGSPGPAAPAGATAAGSPWSWTLGNPHADALLARSALELLLVRAGFGGGAARRAVAAIGERATGAIVPVEGPTVRLEYSAATGEASRLVLDYHGRRRGATCPFASEELARLSDPAVFGHLVHGDVVDVPGPEVSAVIHRDAPPGTVSGRIRLATGEPVVGARVIISSATGPAIALESGAAGAFTAGGLPEGPTRYRVLHRAGPILLTASGPGPVVRRSGSGAPPELSLLLPAPAARPRVALPAGPALQPGSRLVIDARQLELSAVTDAGGRARIPRAPGAPVVSLDGPAGGTVSVSVEPDGAFLAIATATASRRPLAGATLRVALPGHRFAARVECDAGPSIPLPAMPAGMYLSTLLAPDGRPTPGGRAVQRPVRIVPGESVVTLALAPAPAPAADRTLAGRVEPAGRARVEVVSLADGRSRFADSGADGRFLVERLHAGPHVVLVRDAAGRTGLAVPGRDRFRGMLCLLGSRILEDQDVYATPADLGSSSPTFGVEVHAFALDNLLEGAGIRDRAAITPHGESPAWSLVATVALCSASGIALATFSLVAGFLVWGLLLSGYLALSALALALASAWIDVAHPVVSMVLVLAYFVQHQYLVERRKAARRKEIFSRFVHPEMVNRILDLDDVVLAGDRSRITVLFSDIRGFTTLSEGMDPKALLELLNEYFSLMEPILLTHHGTHDKYIGDAIMGFFGAPIACPDHALQAVSAAVEMLEANERLRRERDGWFDIGFGIHTGDAVTGLVGAASGAVSYSAIGDTVNLASRLEGLNKQYGSHILVSEFTYREVTDRFECREIPGVVRVKGRVEPVKVYEVLARRGQPPIAAPRPVEEPPH
jgi:class 3 adenylate cyclase/CHASE2 domain-containing sensor protein